MQQRITEVRGDIAAAFLREGAFVSPKRGLTVYLREMGRPGEMLGVFVHDERDPAQVVSYTAERAVLVQDEGSPRIVMFDGMAQSVTKPEGAVVDRDLSVLRFDRFSYDLGELQGSEAAERRRKPSEFFLPELLSISEEDTGRYAIGDYRAEAHEALSAPLYVIALPLMGAAFVISAGFRRQGFAGRVILAAVAALALRLTGLAAKGAVAAQAGLWPLMYAPPVAGILLGLWLIAGQRGRAPRLPGLMAGAR